MTVSINAFDLNLLRIFDALMDERSVLRAGHRVGLSQSAVSHSLARLREIFSDDLFVRTSAGMQPTARALAMAAPIREALLRVDLAVASAKFSAATSHRRFTLAASDYLTVVIVPYVLKILRREAPHIDIVIRPGTRIDLAEQIDLGRIDLAVGSFSSVPGRLKSNLLFHYEDVLIADRRHRNGRRPPGLHDLARTPIFAVSLGGQEEGAFEGFISERGLARRSEMFDRRALTEALAEKKLTPRIALIQPHFLALPTLLADSKAIAIVPRPLAALFAKSGRIAAYKTPYATEPVPVHAVWHERNQNDPAHMWFRRLCERACAAMLPRKPAKK